MYMDLKKIKMLMEIILFVGVLTSPLIVSAQNAPTLKITASPANIGQLKVGVEFSVSLLASGGVGPYTWSQATGLPPGLSVKRDPFANNNQILVISGNPTVAGAYAFSVTVKDTKNNFIDKSIPFVIADASGNVPGGSGQQGGGPGSGTPSSGNGVDVAAFYNPTKFEDIPSFIVKLINIILSVVGILAVLFIIIGGLRYITSAGSPASVTAAKNTVLYALMGLIVSVLSFAIVQVITNLLINK